MKTWADCKNLLVIRADNMGDLLLSSPAIEAIKEQLACKITVLTSTKAQGIVSMLPFIDDLLVFDVPWVKLEGNNDPSAFFSLLTQIKAKAFDACVVFTVYSQNPMPAILLAYLAEIPLRLAYCRENPYHLLSHWVPDPEPYQMIKHQVQRDLDLVAAIGIKSAIKALQLNVPETAANNARYKIKTTGLDIQQYPFYILHPGVSEAKRRYPKELWIALAQKLLQQQHLPLILSGSAAEKNITDEIAGMVGDGCFSVAGLLELDEFAALIDRAKAVITVNTGTVHLAAALQCPVVVLHAQTNPQHSPWMVPHQVLEYSVPELLRSNNEVIRWVDQLLYSRYRPYPEADEIIAALNAIT
ncbi:glycosyltransferase family 9 protein [Pedobacter immunditicola]|uniref:glycosyltransferase family 9 protein n=1 Tax=Pedobacter immunditicola TaxID=3133440 RepID=UPI0030A8568F